MKAFISAMAIVLMVLAAPTACPQQPAGSAGGDSAGNSQPDGGKKEQCLVPGEMDIVFVNYVVAGNLKYTVGVYLMDGECDMIDTGGDKWMKVTLVAIDSIGRRLDPKLDSSPQASPFGATVTFAIPTMYSLEVVATGNMGRSEIESSETVFIGCALIPIGKTGTPVSTNLADIGGGKGKATCRVQG